MEKEKDEEKKKQLKADISPDTDEETVDSMMKELPEKSDF